MYVNHYQVRVPRIGPAPCKVQNPVHLGRPHAETIIDNVYLLCHDDCFGVYDGNVDEKLRDHLGDGKPPTSLH